MMRLLLLATLIHSASTIGEKITVRDALAAARNQALKVPTKTVPLSSPASVLLRPEASAASSALARLGPGAIFRSVFFGVLGLVRAVVTSPLRLVGAVGIAAVAAFRGMATRPTAAEGAATATATATATASGAADARRVVRDVFADDAAEVVPEETAAAKAAGAAAASATAAGPSSSALWSVLVGAYSINAFRVRAFTGSVLCAALSAGIMRGAPSAAFSVVATLLAIAALELLFRGANAAAAAPRTAPRIKRAAVPNALRERKASAAAPCTPEGAAAEAAASPVASPPLVRKPLGEMSASSNLLPIGSPRIGGSATPHSPLPRPKGSPASVVSQRSTNSSVYWPSGDEGFTDDSMSPASDGGASPAKVTGVPFLTQPLLDRLDSLQTPRSSGKWLLKRQLSSMGGENIDPQSSRKAPEPAAALTKERRSAEKRRVSFAPSPPKERSGPLVAPEGAAERESVLYVEVSSSESEASDAEDIAFAMDAAVVRNTMYNFQAFSKDLAEISLTSDTPPELRPRVAPDSPEDMTVRVTF